MKIGKLLVLLAWCLLITSCGPLSGQAVKSTEGLKRFEVVKGNLAALREVESLLVFAPFLGTGGQRQECPAGEECIYPYNREIDFVTKYNDAQRFAEGLQKAGLFATELYQQVHYDQAEATVRRLKSMTGRQIQTELDLDRRPGMILFGMVSTRNREVAPLRGVVIDVVYRLEFYNPESGQSILLDAAVKGLFKEDLRMIISEIKGRLAGG